MKKTRPDLLKLVYQNIHLQKDILLCVNCSVSWTALYRQAVHSFFDQKDSSVKIARALLLKMACFLLKQSAQTSSK